MIDAQKIKLYLSLFKGIGLSDLSEIFKLIQIKRLKPSEIYIAEGSLHRKIAYIKQGLVRAYLITENGDEKTILVRWEDQFIASYDNILFNEPSRFLYEALEPTILLEVDYDLAQSFAKKNPKFEEARRHFLIKMLSESLLRNESFILLTPQERYLKFLKDKPNIALRLPNKIIASLLGITPVSLSRIRKRISVSKKH